MSDDFKNLVNGLYDLLLPVTEADVRKRAVKSALMMLGDDPGFVEQKAKPSGSSDGVVNEGDEVQGEFNAKTKTWMRQNKLTAEQIAQVFHIEGETVDLIANKVPGASARERAVNTYVLLGLRELLRTGQAKFDEETAKNECERLGTHGKTNHATYAKSGGNLLAGSAKNGWTLTAPGQTAGAALVRELTADSA
jgi:hypothetical protein